MVKEVPTRDTLLTSLQNDEQRFSTLIGRLSDTEQKRPFTPEGWSIKDFLAHMTHWKRETHRLLVAYLHDQPLPPAVSAGDEANAQQRKQEQKRPLADIQNEWMEIHTYLRHLLVDELDDAHLMDNIRTPWSDQQTEHICTLIGDMCEHDAEHFDLIEQHFPH